MKATKSGPIWVVLAALLAVPAWSTLAAEEAGAGGISWRTSYQEAVKEAERAKKPLLIDFTASWCGWCKVLDRMTWPDADVIKAAERYIPVKIDGDKERQLVQKYGVRGFPAIFLASATGEVLHSIGGYLPPDPMAYALNALGTERAFEPAPDELLKTEPKSLHERVMVATAAFQKEDWARVLAVLEPQLGTVPPGKRASYDIAVQLAAYAHAQSGAPEKGIALLEDAIDDADVLDKNNLQRALRNLQSMPGK